jgi:hypothetical protein
MDEALCVTLRSRLAQDSSFNSPLPPSGMRCLTPAMRVRVHNGMICSPTPRVVCPKAHARGLVRKAPASTAGRLCVPGWPTWPANATAFARVRTRRGVVLRARTANGRAYPLGRKGLQPRPRLLALRYKTRQGVQPCLGFCASRLIPQKPRRASRESGSASLRVGVGSPTYCPMQAAGGA